MESFVKIMQKNAPMQTRLQFCVHHAERRADVRAVPYAVFCAENGSDAKMNCRNELQKWVEETSAVVCADAYADTLAVLRADVFCRKNCTDAESRAVLRADNVAIIRQLRINARWAFKIIYLSIDEAQNYSTKMEGHSTKTKQSYSKQNIVE